MNRRTIISQLPFSAIAIAGMVLVYLITASFGPGVSTDAVEYLSTAESLALGKGFINYKGEHYIYWAPLYPILLAMPRLFLNVSPFISGWILNGLAFGAIIYLCGVFINSYFPDRAIWAWLGAGTACFSTTLIGISTNIGTDPLFIVLVILFLLFLNRYADRKDRRSLAVLIGLASLAAALRYVGVTLILSGGILLLYIHKTDLKRGLFRGTIFGTLSMIPLLVWMMRNIAVTGTFFGVRYPSTWLFSENLQDAIIKISHWFIPYTLSSNPAFLLISGLILLLVLLKNRRAQYFNFLDKLKKPAYVAVILFIIIYLGAILALTKTEDHVKLFYDDRYYAPILIPLFLLLFQFINDFVLPLLPARVSRFDHWVVLGLFSVWMVYPIFSSYKLWEKTQKEEGIPYYNLYNLPRYRDSKITRQLDNYLTSSNQGVYSNYPAVVYYYTHHFAESSPSNRGNGESKRNLESYAGFWPVSTPAILVWFEPNTKKFLYPPTKLGTLVPLEPLFTSRDGGIYRLGAED